MQCFLFKYNKINAREAEKYKLYDIGGMGYAAFYEIEILHADMVHLNLLSGKQR